VDDWSDKKKHPTLFNHILKIGLKSVSTTFFPSSKDVKENGFVLEFALNTYIHQVIHSLITREDKNREIRYKSMKCLLYNSVQ
jgi:hypothetical protein